MDAPRHTAATFGPLLRYWRLARRMSQLAFATEAEISTRHLSFLETGRAQPSREMIQHLGNVLDVPLGERNALLLAAGYVPAYGERELQAPDLEHVRRALQFILKQQEPYPAIVVDGSWNVVLRNEASWRMFKLFQNPAEPETDKTAPTNAMRRVFDPNDLRRFIVNWEEFAGALIQMIHREAAASPAVARLRDELLSYSGVPSRWKTPDPHTLLPPLLTMQLKKGDLSLAFFSTITTLANPFDITLQQLRIECFHPANTTTEETMRRLASAEVAD